MAAAAALEEFNTCNDENERLTRSLARSFETKALCSPPSLSLPPLRHPVRVSNYLRAAKEKEGPNEREQRERESDGTEGARRWR